MAEDWMRMKTKKEFEIMLEIAKISRLISIISVSVTCILFTEYMILQVTKNQS